jgi:small subunit ribosomal protein S1
LLVEAGGIDGFIPVSQLSADHYPRVQNGSGSEIARRLQEIIGQMLKVKVLSADKKTSKLIFSEKAAQGLLQETAVDTVKLGDVLDGTVTGITSFGLFMNAGGVEGLVHISEVSWDRVANINTLYAVGDTMKVKVIQIDGNRVSFSIKRMLPDPWIQAFEDYKPNTIVEGTVTRVTDFGAFVKISDHVAGLCHVSQMGEGVKDPNEVLAMGKKYQFRIISIEPATHRCSLQLASGGEATPEKPTKAIKPKAPKAKEQKVKKAKKEVDKNKK